jgi:hypothetical protein
MGAFTLVRESQSSIFIGWLEQKWAGMMINAKEGRSAAVIPVGASKSQ